MESDLAFVVVHPSIHPSIQSIGCIVVLNMNVVTLDVGGIEGIRIFMKPSSIGEKLEGHEHGAQSRVHIGVQTRREFPYVLDDPTPLGPRYGVYRDVLPYVQLLLGVLILR